MKRRAAAVAHTPTENEPPNRGDNGRGRNTYPGNCSECHKCVEAHEGYLFKNTKYCTSKGYHVKCEDCFTGATAKHLKKEEKKGRTKTLSVNFAKKWLQSLQMKHQDVVYLNDKKNPVSCEVYTQTSLILGWNDFGQGHQEYPTEEWCQEQATKLGGHFSENAVSYICEELTERIQVRIGEGEVLSLIEQDSHPLKLIPLEQTMSINSVERKHIEKALIGLNLLGRIELRTTKIGTARCLGIDLVSIGGINYGFLKYE
jgi:hypothetical protein